MEVSIRLRFPLKPNTDTSLFCPCWMNGESAIAKDRASLQYRARFTILQHATKMRKIQKIFAKSKYCNSYFDWYYSSFIGLMKLINLTTQVDSFAEANGMGTVSVVD